ncbi:MAG TPA: transposase [Armatimonadota bacterium]
MDYTVLQTWRVALYATMTRNAAVLMNILDALLSATHARRAIELTLTLAFARQWPSFYQGLQEGHLHRSALRQVYCAQVPWTPGQRLVLILDTTGILRPQAPTARDRMTVHTATRADGGTPRGLGWQFSLLVVAPDPPSSWTYTLDCTRVRTGTTPARLGALQVADVLPHLPARPLLLGDRYYGSATFVLDPRLTACDKLVRLQTHRVFYWPPPPRGPHQRGRPPRKGARFQPKDPATHGPPTATWTGTDARGRRVTVRAWAGLAFAEALSHPVTLLECARHDGRDTKADPRVIWLLWDSPSEAAPLPEIPDRYAQRFSVEHGIRFTKQTLLWEAPHVRTAAFQVWTDLVMAAQNTLYLARPICAGVRLPWDRQAPVTPQQVRRALAAILPTLGSPAPSPQPRGKSPGRRPGCHPHPAPRFSIVWKGRAATAHAPPNPV